MTKTVESTIAFQNPQGGIVASGKLILDLSQPALVTSGGGLIAPTRVSITLNTSALIPAATLLYGNDELTPTGTTYHAKLYNSVDALVADFGNWSITGVSPIDLSQMVPTSNGASYPSGVYFVDQAANTVLAGPTTGADAPPAFRILVADDIPLTLPDRVLADAVLNDPILNDATINTAAIEDATLTGTTTIPSPVINGTPTGTGIATTTLKVGSAGGAYTRSANTYADIDGTNLAYTVTVPTGWKAIITFCCSANVPAGSGAFAITDGTTLLREQAAPGSGLVTAGPVSLSHIYTGDGNSHTFKARFKSDGVNTLTVINGSSTDAPVIVTQLMPSN